MEDLNWDKVREKGRGTGCYAKTEYMKDRLQVPYQSTYVIVKKNAVFVKIF